MKTKLAYLLLALLIPFWAACSDDNDDTGTDSNNWVIEGTSNINLSDGNIFSVSGLPTGTGVNWRLSSEADFTVETLSYNTARVKAKAAGKTAVLYADIVQGESTLGTAQMTIQSANE